MKLSNNKILITGGATGIGLGLVERFVRENNTVIICGRREAALREVAVKFPSVITKVCDLTIEAERIELYEWVVKNHSDLTVLVNNAGIMNWKKVTDSDFYEMANNEITTNVIAPLHLTNLFLNLKSLNTIMNVTSGLAFVPVSGASVYCGTKAFLRSFTLSLRHSLKSTGIEVIEIIPPALSTDISGGKNRNMGYPSVDDFIESIFQQLKKGKTELTFGTSETRAKATNDAIREYYNKLNP
jgi:uncharacterized oxidoreductase